MTWKSKIFHSAFLSIKIASERSDTVSGLLPLRTLSTQRTKRAGKYLGIKPVTKSDEPVLPQQTSKALKKARIEGMYHPFKTY